MEKIEIKMRKTDEELGIAKVAIEKVKKEFIDDLKKAYPAYIGAEIKKFIESDTGSDLFMKLSREEVEKLKQEISNVVKKDVSKIIKKIYGLNEWFKCNIDVKSRNYGLGLNSQIWKTMKSIDKYIIEILQKYGLKVLDATWGDYFFTPADWSSFGKTIPKLHEKFVKVKEKYCNCIKRRDELMLEYKKHMAKKKWELIPIQ